MEEKLFKDVSAKVSRVCHPFIFHQTFIMQYRHAELARRCDDVNQISNLEDYDTSKWNQILYVNLLSSATSAAALALGLYSVQPHTIVGLQAGAVLGDCCRSDPAK